MKAERSDDFLERDPELESDNQAQLDELGDDPAEVGARSAGQAGGSVGLSHIAEADEESIEELADTGQGWESDAIDGVEDAADHPERPVHTHQDYGRPDDVPPERGSE